MKILKSFLISFLMIDFACIDASDTSFTDGETDTASTSTVNIKRKKFYIEPVKDSTIDLSENGENFEIIKHPHEYGDSLKDKSAINSINEKMKLLCDIFNGVDNFNTNFLQDTSIINAFGVKIDAYIYPETSKSYLDGNLQIKLIPGTKKDDIHSNVKEMKKLLKDQYELHLTYKIE